MENQISTALKEWAVVQRALLEGTQIMLIRKGGLVEDTNQFDLRSRNFLILPTYIHSQERQADVKLQYLEWLHKEESRKAVDGAIRFEAYCEVVECIQIKNPDALLALNDEHIWSDSYIQMRENWEPYKPLFTIVVRTYQLQKPVEIPMHADYFGCKSWIDLQESINVEGAIASIKNDSEFEHRVEVIRTALSI